MKIILLSSAVFFLLLLFGRSSIERRLLFFPSHNSPDPHRDGELTPWSQNNQIIGIARIVRSPRNVWLMLHGNAGQASDRTNALPSFSPDDSVYILEYPGFGKRSGTPTMEAINSAAKEAYLILRQTFPKTPVCVAAESIGTGPASWLASVDPAPDKIVLITPFASLGAVARDHFPNFAVRLLLSHHWDNIAALSQYKGPVQIYAASSDSIIDPRPRWGSIRARFRPPERQIREKICRTRAEGFLE